MTDAVTAAEESGRPRRSKHSVVFWLGFGAVVVVVVSRAAGPSHRLAAASAPARPLSDCALSAGNPAGGSRPLAQQAKKKLSENQREGVTRSAVSVRPPVWCVGKPLNDVQRCHTKMSRSPIREDTAEIYCRPGTKEDIRGLKRGGETYDELFARLSKQYDPAVGRSMEGSDDGY